MASKKVRDNVSLDSGMWAYYGHPDDDYTANAEGFINPETGERGFVISYHHGEMPAFNSEGFDTLDDLEAAMRKVEPDLRKWRTTRGG
jgi:hypothetical protein